MAGRRFRAAVIPEVTARGICRHNDVMERGDGTFYCNQCRQNLALRGGRYVPLTSVRALAEAEAIPSPLAEAEAIPVVHAIPKIYGGTLKWLGNSVKENVKAKTLESLALVIGAVILGSFGFIFAGIGLIFFMAFLYLPGEAEVMSRARKQAEDLPMNQFALLRSAMRDIVSAEEEKEGATVEQIKEINKRLKSLREKKDRVVETLEARGFKEDADRIVKEYQR